MPNNYLDGVTINGTEYELRDASVPGQIANKANDDGYYENMTVGQAEQLVSTVGIEDKVPYNFRTSGGTADIGDRLTEKIVGGTVAWNQLMFPLDELSPVKCTIAVTSGVATMTVNENGISDGRMTLSKSSNIVITLPGHKYLITLDVNPSIAISRARIALGDKVVLNAIRTFTENVWYTFAGIVPNTQSNNGYRQIDIYGTFAEGDTVRIRNAQIIDLTLLFGSTIADYIYSLETANAGAGVAWFKKLFPKPYYEYNAGELMSVQTSAHNMVGFNAWDGSNSVIVGSYRLIDVPTLLLGKCSMTLKDKDTSVTLPNGCAIGFVRADWEPSQGVLTNQDYRWVYYSGAIRSNTSNTSGGTSAADGDKLLGKILIFPNTLAAFEAITSRFYLGVNLSWDGERDGEYEPYELHSYPLDSDLVLRGIPKLDSNNELYYDGDTYEADGTVTRKYGIVDLGTKTWNLYTGVSGANIYYWSPSDCRHAFDFRIGGGYNKAVNNNTLANLINKEALTGAGAGGSIWIRNDSISTVQDFKTAMSGVYLVYELETPTTETADPFQTPQIVNDFGTEEYVDAGERDVAIPVGHETYYQNNLRAKLEMAPDSPGDGDGDYVVRQTNGINEYVQLVIPAELPTNPSEDGEFLLKATVSNGVTTLSWVTQ